METLSNQTGQVLIPASTLAHDAVTKIPLSAPQPPSNLSMAAPRSAQRHFPGSHNLLFIYLPVVLLFFQYQINWLYDASEIKLQLQALILALTGIFVLTEIRRKLITFGIIIVGFLTLLLFNDIPRSIYATVCFGYGCALVLVRNSELNSTIKFIFVINGILVFFQIAGVDELFYSFQSYSPNYTEFRSFFSNDSSGVPVHQMRVSGMFPSTIYLSLFQFLTLGQLVASKKYGTRGAYFFTGFVFALIASAVSLMLFAFTIIYILRRPRVVYYQAGFILGVFVLFLFFNPIFSENYDYAEKMTRIGTRFIDDGGNSVLTDNIVNFYLIVSLSAIIWVIAFLSKAIRLDVLGLILFFLMVVGPMIVHSILTDVRFWFVFGTAAAQLWQKDVFSGYASNTMTARTAVKNASIPSALST